MRRQVLLFHQIEESPSQHGSVSRVFLDALLKTIRQLGRSATSLPLSGSQTDVVLTFDDGCESDYQIVFPLLQSLGFSATFFVVPEWVGTPGYMGWDHIREMSEAGMDIGSHTFSHPYLTSLSVEKQKEELQKSKKEIENHLSKPICSFSFPHGDFSRKTLMLAHEVGYRYVACSRPGFSSTFEGPIARNSMHSLYQVQDVPAVVSPRYAQIQIKVARYYGLRLIQTTIGTSRYIQMRNKIVRAIRVLKGDKFTV